MNPFVRNVVTALAGVIAAAACAAAEPYPSKPITIVVPFGAGSASDLFARAYAKALTENLKGTVIVENRPGASAMLGAQAVAKAAPDGYTLLLGSGTANAVNYALYASTITYRPESFSPIAVLWASPIVMFTPAATGATSVKQALASAKSGKGLSCASGNAVTEVACGVLKAQSRSEMVTVPYKSTSQALTDLSGGQIDIAFSDLGAGLSFIQGGRVTPIAAASVQRLESLPTVPTFAEQGFQDFKFTSWAGLFAPAGTPEPIVEALNGVVRKMLASQEWDKQRAASSGMPLTGDLAESRRFVADEIVRWGRYIKDSGVKVQ
jgi:tripartite-type tricarboxylate transporter receptor subunit TctC